MSTISRFATYFLLMTCVSSVALAAENENVLPLKARAEINWRAGDERSIALTEFWVPVRQDRDSVLFTDIRMMGDNHDNREGNVGVGYRQMMDSPLLGEGIAGVTGWIDRRITERGSHFHQMTFGAEWLGDTFDLRANAYAPLSDAKSYSSGETSDPYLAGTGIFVDIAGETLEEPQKGFDLELGYTVPFLENHTDSARVYAGGYYFDGDHTDDVAGWRVRAAADLTEDVQVGARFQHDDERGAQGFLEATIRFPFGQKKSYRREGLRARLDESPERDVDIVTGAVTLESQRTEPVLNSTTGTAQQILYVDNTAGAGGDGSIETPFNTLAAAEAASTAHGIIYVYEGAGAAGQDQGITLAHAGQKLIGAGSNLVWDGNAFTSHSGGNFSGFVLLPATAPPIITNTAGHGLTITGDEVSVEGILVDNSAGYGAYITGNNATLHNASIENSGGGDGIFASHVRGLTISDITTANNSGNGIYIESNGAGVITDNVNITNVGAIGNGLSGVVVVANAGGLTDSVSLSNITATGNTQRGIYALASSSQISNLRIDDSTLSSNGSYGLQIGASSGTLTSPIINNVTVTGNSSNGIYLNSSGTGAINSATLSDITTTGNSGSGVYLYATGVNARINSPLLDSVTASSNSVHGIYVHSLNTAQIVSPIIQNSIMDANSIQGLSFFAVSSGKIVSPVLQNLTSTNNFQYGFLLQGIFAVSQITDLQATNLVAAGNSTGLRTLGNNSTLISAAFEDSSFSNNINYGVDLSISANAEQRLSFETTTIANNGVDGLVVSDNSTQSFNIDLGGGSFGSIGQNRIFGNPTVDLFLDLDNASLTAENNWWGDPLGLLPGRYFVSGLETIDSTPFLAADPNP